MYICTSTVIKQLVHAFSCALSSYGANRKFGKTLEARVALGYRPEQLLPFFCVLQTLHVYHNLLVHINAQDNC